MNAYLSTLQLYMVKRLTNFILLVKFIIGNVCMIVKGVFSMSTSLTAMRNLWGGLWVNEKKSTMDISAIHSFAQGKELFNHYRIEGTYTTKVGRAQKEESSPLTGFVAGNLICFTVSFFVIDEEKRESRSITAWSGQLLDTTTGRGSTEKSLQTVWNLVPDLEQHRPEEFGWVLTWSGQDKFLRLVG